MAQMLNVSGLCKDVSVLVRTKTDHVFGCVIGHTYVHSFINTQNMLVENGAKSRIRVLLHSYYVLIYSRLVQTGLQDALECCVVVVSGRFHDCTQHPTQLLVRRFRETNKKNLCLEAAMQIYGCGREERRNQKLSIKM